MFGKVAVASVMAFASLHCGPIRQTPPSGDAAVRDVQRGDSGPALASGRVRDCDARFVYPLGRQSSGVFVGGSFNSWSATGLRMIDGLFSNTYRASASLPPGVYQYKFIADGQWNLDPTHRYTAYDNGNENSRLDVPDCSKPELKLVRATASADRTIDIVFDYYDGTTLAGADMASIVVTMNRMPLAASAIQFDAENMRLTLHVQVPEDNKYTFKVSMSDRAMHAAEDVFVPLWVEPEPFQWNDGPLYFTFTDRFRNGDPSNDSPIAGVDMRANYRGGDLKGVLASLRDGYFRSMGVRSIWLSPVNANTDSAGRGGDGRMYSAYHGYWVSEPRTVEEHFGTLEDLRAVTSEAHRQGIRILIDIANNQLHRDHPYFRDHRDWFNGDGTCVCGGNNCDWDSHRLDCWFTSYLPDVRWTNMRAVDQMADDALFWLTEADVDGFRVDAVKHMEHISSTTLRRRIHDRLEGAGTQYYLVGETFTGADGHGLVQEYIGREELSGQFDFPLFWAIRRAFASNEGTMMDLDNAVRTGERVYQNALMSPFLGNHDVERFLSQAAGDLMGNTMDQAWNNPPAAPDRDEPYERLFLAFAFLLGQPGVPLIYYGDEVGMPGAADPDNRRLMRFGMDLSARESRLLDRIKIVARARGTHPGLRRGARRTLHTDGDGYVFARGAASNLAIVAINRGTTARMVRVMVPAELAENGVTLRDLLGGSSVTVRDGAIDVPFTPRNAALFVRE